MKRVGKEFQKKNTGKIHAITINALFKGVRFTEEILKN